MADDRQTTSHKTLAFNPEDEKTMDIIADQVVSPHQTLQDESAILELIAPLSGHSSGTSLNDISPGANRNKVITLH